VAGYTGVLLSCTANPLWSKNRWLGAFFSASALSTGAAATRLAIRSKTDTPSHNVLEKIDTCAHIAEAVTLRNFLKEAGPKARPLTHGSMKGIFALAVGSVVASEVVKHLPLRGKPRRFAGNLGSILALAGGFALRWALIYGGKEAAADPHLARLATNTRNKPARALPSSRRKQIATQPA